MVKFAFVIGINYNFIHESKRLAGCIHDAMRIKNMLVNSLGFSDEHIYILTDENENVTSHREIKKILESLKNKSLRTSDELWIYYSGHGNSVIDTNGDENDGKDSVILPSDYMENGYISDDDLHEWSRDIQCKILMIFDSCHSGTIADLPWKFTYREPSDVLIERERDIEIKNKHIFTLSGSTDAQKSWEIYNKSIKQSYGEFTNTFLRVLENNNYNISIMKLYEQISQPFLTKQFGEQQVIQTPLLSSSSRIPDWIIQK
jgi:hypothetical protein